MSRQMHRRSFLRRAAYGLAAAPFASLLSCGSHSSARASALLRAAGDDPLDLAPGLSVTVLDRTGRLLRDGFVSPARPDGMGCFLDEDGAWVLMRNHEIDQKHIGEADGLGAYELDAVPSEAYSVTSLGGVTRLVVDPETLTITGSNLVLSGTRKNCAGGQTPMGWLSCEETVDDAGEHGFVYLCDAQATSLQPARRIDAYGRFLHEAAGFDTESGICYLTEDRDKSCLYRFRPDAAGRPFDGRLQALRVVQEPVFETTTMAVGRTHVVDWVDVPNPLAGVDVAPQCQAIGAAVFVRGEGCWFDEQRLVFAATGGGPAGAGQIFELSNDRRDGTGTLQVLAVAGDDANIVRPDNLTIAPDGSVFFAEDNDGECLIQRLGTNGSIEPIARNVEGGEEIAGLCFSPDGSVLFANIQEPGITVAISGF